MHARTSRSRKSNRSTYVEPQSIFGSAMESLFGKNSIFSALDGPPSDESSLEQADAEEGDASFEQRRAEMSAQSRT